MSSVRGAKFREGTVLRKKMCKKSCLENQSPESMIPDLDFAKNSNFLRFEAKCSKLSSKPKHEVFASMGVQDSKEDDYYFLSQFITLVYPLKGLV